MPSPSFSINGESINTKASVTASSSVVATLDSLVGVSTVTWEISGTDETTEAADYTLALSGAKNSVCTTTALTAGTAAILKCTINGGVDPFTGEARPEYVQTVKFYVPTASGYEVGCVGETNESDPVYGATGIINAAVRGISGVASPIMGIPVRATSTGNIANLASASVSQDGITLVAGDRFLLKDQSTASQNGVYVVGTVSVGNAPLTRATDLDSSAEAVPGITYYVQEGTAGAETFWTLTTPLPITLGSTSLAFEEKIGSLPYAADSAATPDTLALRDANADIAFNDVEFRDAIGSRHIKFLETHSTPELRQDQRPGNSGTAGAVLAISAQQGQNTSGGSNANGGNLVLATGAPGTGGSGGTAGSFIPKLGSTNAYTLADVSGTLRQTIDGTWSRYDIATTGTAGIRLWAAGTGTVDARADQVYLVGATDGANHAYFDLSDSSKTTFVTQRLNAEFNIMAASGTGAETAKTFTIKGQTGKARSGANNNNDGGNIILQSGAPGTGGSGTAGDPGEVQIAIASTTSAAFFITDVGFGPTSALQFRGTGIANISVENGIQTLAFTNPTANGTMVIAAADGLSINDEAFGDIMQLKDDGTDVIIRFADRSQAVKLEMEAAQSGSGFPMHVIAQDGASTNDDGGTLFLGSGASGGGTGLNGDIQLLLGDTGPTAVLTESASGDLSLILDATANTNVVRITSDSASNGGIIELRAADKQDVGEVTGHGIARVVGADGNALESAGGSAAVVGGDGYVVSTGGPGGAGSVSGGDAQGSGNNAGGGAFMIGGTPTGSGTGGGVTLTAANGVTNGAGGAVGVTSGNGQGTGNGGAITVTSGNGGATNGDGGAITLASGDGNTPGTISVLAGDGSGASRGGHIVVTAGAAGSSGVGGDITLTSGRGVGSASGTVALVGGDQNGGSSGAGGAITATGGNGGGAGGDGGAVTLTGGVAGSGAAGGNVGINGGDGETSGGEVRITGGGGNATDSAGGDVIITGGDSTGTADAGDIYLAPGSAPGDGRASNIGLLTNSGSFGGGQLVIFIANATTVPGSNPTGGGVLYAEGGALKWRGSSGTVTELGPA